MVTKSAKGKEIVARQLYGALSLVEQLSDVVCVNPPGAAQLRAVMEAGPGEAVRRGGTVKQGTGLGQLNAWRPGLCKAGVGQGGRAGSVEVEAYTGGHGVRAGHTRIHNTEPNKMHQGKRRNDEAAEDS